mgnify:CR=1 FL=1
MDFLGGHYEPLLKSLEDKMYDASEKMEFEKAIEYRELLNSVKQIARSKRSPAADGKTGILLPWQETWKMW